MHGVVWMVVRTAMQVTEGTVVETAVRTLKEVLVAPSRRLWSDVHTEDMVLLSLPSFPQLHTVLGLSLTAMYMTTPNTVLDRGLLLDTTLMAAAPVLAQAMALALVLLQA
jgi:hypothetical protein